MASRKNKRIVRTELIDEELVKNLSATCKYISKTADSVLPDVIQSSVEKITKATVKWIESIVKQCKTPIVDKHRQLCIYQSQTNHCNEIIIIWWPNGIIKVFCPNQGIDTQFLGHTYKLPDESKAKAINPIREEHNRVADNYKDMIFIYGDYRGDNLRAANLTKCGWESPDFVLNFYLSEKFSSEKPNYEMKSLVNLRKNIKTFKKNLKNLDVHYERLPGLKDFVIETLFGSPTAFRDNLQKFLVQFIADLHVESERLTLDPDRKLSYGKTPEEHYDCLLNEWLRDFNNNIDDLINQKDYLSHAGHFNCLGYDMVRDSDNLANFPHTIIKFGRFNEPTLQMARFLSAAYPELFRLEIKPYLKKEIARRSDYNINYDSFDSYDFHTAMETMRLDLSDLIDEYSILCDELLDPIETPKGKRKKYTVLVPNNSTIKAIYDKLAGYKTFPGSGYHQENAHDLESIIKPNLSEGPSLFRKSYWIDMYGVNLPKGTRPICLYFQDSLRKLYGNLIDKGVLCIYNNKEIPMDLVNDEINHFLETTFEMETTQSDQYIEIKKQMNEKADSMLSMLDVLENDLLVSESTDFIQWCIKKKLVEPVKGNARIEELKTKEAA